MPQFDFTHVFWPQLAWLAVSFAVLYFGVVRLTLPKLGKVMDDREKSIAGDLATARAAKQTADEIDEAYHAEMNASRDEARAIAIKDAKVWTGEHATSARLLDPLVQDAAVLHFATHAVNDPRRPERSHLRLAGKHGDLTAAKVESLGLHADLVSLSGCRTAGGVGLLARG